MQNTVAVVDPDPIQINSRINSTVLSGPYKPNRINV